MTEKKPSFGHLIEQNRGEIKRRELELGSHSWMDGLAAELFRPRSTVAFSDTVFVTLCRAHSC